MIAATPAWPQHVAVREAAVVVSQTASSGFLYTLTSRTEGPANGPYTLERTSLRTGARRRGPTFAALDGVEVAAGRVWVFGIGARAATKEVDPRTLAVVRTFSTPTTDLSANATDGPRGSAWIGGGSTLLRVDPRTGNVLARARVPTSLTVSDLAADPGGRYLYVSTARVVKGGVEGCVVLEYDEASGRELARHEIAYSVAGAGLTAVPGGVWASFRTGLLGQTIRLRQRDLAVVSRPSGIFEWAMYATAIYAGGALWFTSQSGVVACLDPATGRTRAAEHLGQSRTIDFVGVDARSRRIVALAGARPHVDEITPPASCWRR
jgi:outer membrane protein assembly factor BamB